MRILNYKNWARETIPPIAAYVALDIALTLILFAISPESVKIGTLRPVSTIPPKLFQLALAGLAVGLIASITFRKLDLNLILLGVAFVALLDVDHLPSMLGKDQPIRPAHSFLFLAILLLVLAFTAKKQPWVELIAVSAFCAHLASDTGGFAFFMPCSFTYTSIDRYRVPFALGAVTFALLAGYAKHRKYLKQKQVPKSVVLN